MYFCTTTTRCDICKLLDTSAYANYNIREKDIYFTEGHEYQLSPNEKNVCTHTEWMDYDQIQKTKRMLDDQIFRDLAVTFPVTKDKAPVFKTFCKDILKTPLADNMTKENLQQAVTTWKTNNSVDWVTCMTATTNVIKENFKVMKVTPKRYADLLAMSKLKDPMSFPLRQSLIENERNVLKYCLYLGKLFINYLYIICI